MSRIPQNEPVCPITLSLQQVLLSPQLCCTFLGLGTDGTLLPKGTKCQGTAS